MTSTTDDDLAGAEIAPEDLAGLAEMLGIIPSFPEVPESKRFKLDLTDIAKAYGLRKIPPVVWDFDEQEHQHTAAGYGSDDKLHIGSLLTQAKWLTDNYNEGRFARVGVSRLGATDAVRFIIAHELWHVVQEQRRGSFGDDDSHDPNHDNLRIEVEADKHAARYYKLVKINGR